MTFSYDLCPIVAHRRCAARVHGRQQRRRVRPLRLEWLPRPGGDGRRRRRRAQAERRLERLASAGDVQSDNADHWRGCQGRLDPQRLPGEQSHQHCSGPRRRLRPLRVQYRAQRHSGRPAAQHLARRLPEPALRRRADRRRRRRDGGPGRPAITLPGSGDLRPRRAFVRSSVHQPRRLGRAARRERSRPWQRHAAGQRDPAGCAASYSNVRRESAKLG